MPTIRKRGRSWYLCWSEGGQERRKSLGSISEAEARQAARHKKRELDQRRLSNVVAIPRTHVPTFEEWAAEYLRWHEREYPASHDRVRGLFELHLLPHFGITALDRITKAQAERYKESRQAKAETIAKELRQLQACLNRAVFLEIIDRNPVKGIRPPRGVDSKPPRWYTEDELSAIYANARPLAGDEARRKDGALPVNSGVEDYAPIWRLLANTGMRRAEALQLRWIDVGSDALRVLSREGARTKSRQWRQVPLSPGAAEALEAMKATTGKRPHVLPRMHEGSLSRAFDRTLRRAGLDGSLHCLRHTFCAHLVMSGVPLRTVQVLAGHAHSSTTERYSHLSPGHLHDAVRGLIL